MKQKTKFKKIPEGMRPCKRCAGSGHWVEKDQMCFRCEGTGLETNDQPETTWQIKDGKISVVNA